MHYDWSLDADLDPERLSSAGQPRCYQCGAPAPEGIPDRHARCQKCGYHLHCCQNCMFYDGIGCLILSPYIWAGSHVPGQDCPYFVWRRAEMQDVSSYDRERERGNEAPKGAEE